MHQVQAAFIGSAGSCSGTLFLRGRSYPSTAGSAGIGGIGASSIDVPQAMSTTSTTSHSF
jgi:hypothetical protein